MFIDLSFMPSPQDRLDVRKVFVEGRSPMPVSSAMCDIVTDSSPCSTTRAIVVSWIASRTSWRWVSTVSAQSFGIPGVYKV